MVQHHLSVYVCSVRVSSVCPNKSDSNFDSRQQSTTLSLLFPAIPPFSSFVLFLVVILYVPRHCCRNVLIFQNTGIENWGGFWVRSLSIPMALHARAAAPGCRGWEAVFVSIDQAAAHACLSDRTMRLRCTIQPTSINKPETYWLYGLQPESKQGGGI